MTDQPRLPDTDDLSDRDATAGQPETGNVTLVEHLVELRNRLLYSIVAILVVFVCLFYFANDIYAFISEPLRAMLPENSQMIATEVTSPFLTPFKLTLFVSLLVALPFVFYQIWRFVEPALYPHERRLALPIIVSSVVLFYLGMTFAYYAVFPLLFSFFVSSVPEDVAMMTDISAYLSFVLKMFFAFGLAFEVPIVTVLLILMGVTTREKLAKKRSYVILGCFVVGMLLTPPDVFSQTLLAVPMWLLFELGILIARFLPDSRSREEQAEPAQGDTEVR